MILSCQGICKSFGEKVILNDASFHIEEREKAALIGNNGAGKTTLLRIIMEEISADSGQVVLMKDKKIGYLAQYQEIKGHRTIYEELLSTKQYIIDMEDRMRAAEIQMKHASGEELERLMNTYTRLTHEFELENGYAYRSELMGVLKGLGFTEEDFNKQIETLSGGQKTRVALGKLLISKPDILLLDEPTNHLDITSKEILEQALNNYTGTVLYVSHDRYFINQTATRIMDLVNHTFVNYIGNYDYYLEKKEELTAAYSNTSRLENNSSSAAADLASDSKLSWQEQKEAQAKERKRANEFKKTEERIGVLEDRSAEIDILMSQEEVYTNSVKCQELAKERAEIDAELETLYEKWEELAE